MSTNTTTPELQLTPEQTLELEKVRAESAAVNLELAKLEQRGREADAEHARLIQGQAHRDALLASGVKFYDPELTTRLTADFDVRFADDGTATGVVNGKRVGLDKVYQSIAAKYPTIADGRSTRGLKATADEPTVKSKADLGTMATKMAFIDEHGIEAFEKLPLHSTRMKPIETMADYASLSVAQKTEIINKHGIEFVQNLARKKR
jgi:hypothetical protein